MPRDLPGVLIGSGRECDVFDIGNGRVLRRSRLGLAADTEALTIAHVAGHGFPVPQVYDADGPDLILERIRGRTMLQAFARTPWKIHAWGVELAALIEQLAAIPLPDHALSRQSHLSPLPPGNVLTHTDLHPTNVMVTPTGPVVIDWGAATAAQPGLDAALTWLTLASGEVTGPAPVRALGNCLRDVLVKSYASKIDHQRTRPQLPVAFEYRGNGNNITRVEVDRMRQFLDKLA